DFHFSERGRTAIDFVDLDERRAAGPVAIGQLYGVGAGFEGKPVEGSAERFGSAVAVAIQRERAHGAEERGEVPHDGGMAADDAIAFGVEHLDLRGGDKSAHAELRE